MDPVDAPAEYDPQLERTFRGHKAPINAVSFNPNMKQLASASADNCVYVYNFKSKQRAFRFIGHKEPVLDVKFSPSG